MNDARAPGSASALSPFADWLLAPSAPAANASRRALTGLGLCAPFGAAIALPHGPGAVWLHAVGVPAGFAAVALVGAPALYVLSALSGARVGALRLADAVTRALATSGLLLAGLSPVLALVAVTAESLLTTAVFARIAVAFAGGVALARLVRQLAPDLDPARPLRGVLGYGVSLGFGMFACVLAWRVWSVLLPALGGGA